MLRLGFPVVGVADLDRAVAFWTTALPLVATPEWQSEDWVQLDHADGSERAIGLQRSQSPAQPHPRMHLDLLVDTAAEQASEVDRLVSLGASRPEWDSYPADPDFVVLADPDGNLFCVIDLSRTPADLDRAS